MRKNPRRIASGDRYRVGPLDFRVPHDEEESLEVAGMLSLIFEWTYFGFITTIRPSVFLELAAWADLEKDRPKLIGKHYKPGDTSFRSIQRGAKDSVEFAPPFLRIVELNDRWFVIGHEGRHRMLLIQREAQDEYVPVVVEIRVNGFETRARQITDNNIQELNKGAFKEDSNTFVSGPLFGPLAIVNNRDVKTQSRKVRP
jgi:hypothetical protein